MALILKNLVPLLEVFDLPKSIAFYRDVLGFELVSDDERPATPDPARVRGHADTTLFFWSPDPDEVYAHLRGRGGT